MLLSDDLIERFGAKAVGERRIGRRDVGGADFLVGE
jgi:hypothetical protein